MEVHRDRPLAAGAVHPGFGLLAAALSTALLAGCTTVGTSVGRVVDPLNLTGLNRPPVRIGVTTLELTPPLLLSKRALFEDDLASYLKEPVSFDLMTPRQIRVHLGTGRLKFAMLSPGDYCRIADSDQGRILAVPINANGEVYRRGLIIVAAKSPIHSLSELKSRRFHFLPREDLLNEAALGALLEAGVAPTDLDAGLLGLDIYHISSLEVAKSVVFEANGAGVIDEADYNRWKKTGGNFILLTPAQDQVRIIAQTVRVPEGPFVVSKQTPAELTEKVKTYLLKVVEQHKLALAPLGYTGFAEPIDPKEYEPFFAIHRKLHPPKPEEAATQESESEEPASEPN